MVDHTSTDEAVVYAPTRADDRREAIRRAAVAQFIERGFQATSMAHIAKAADVSRPALYQYFSDKEDIFAAAFASVFEVRVDAALDALTTGANPFQSLDGMLQRFEGDLWDLTASSPHHAELLEAKSMVVMDAITVELVRLWTAVGQHLEMFVPGKSKAKLALRADWLDMLKWSPRGFKIDQPSVETYRRRLTALARSIAAEMVDHVSPA